MEQDAVFDLGDYDEETISLNEPPRSALHYLHQTAIQRSRCTDVVSVEGVAALGQPSSSKKLVVDSAKKPAANLPSEEWCKAKCALFSKYRSEIEARKSSCPGIKGLNFPAATDYKRWIKFCCLKENSGSSNTKTSQPHDKNTARRAPTLPLILSLTEFQVNCLVEHLTEFFKENEYSRELFEWYYAALMVLDNTPPADTCVAIREFAKHAKELRSTITESSSAENTIVYELTLFIAIISMYFEQRDLADYPQVLPSSVI